MQIYLDTSALTKLVFRERETHALHSFLADHQNDSRCVAALARTELVRAAVRRGPAEAITHAHRLLRRIDLLPLTSRLLDEAAMLPPWGVRCLDAIHLAAAQSAPSLRALITYDVRMAEAAAAIGMPVEQPA